MKYRIGFQCPDSGMPVLARYIARRLSILIDPDPDHFETPEQMDRCARVTRNWASRVRGRYPSLQAATCALEHAGVNTRADEGKDH